jgi:hypothetical protein
MRLLKWGSRIVVVGIVLWMIGMVYQGRADAAATAIAWQYDFSANPPCAVTVTTGCVNGFEIHHFAAGVDTLDATVPLPASPVGLMALTVPIPVTFPKGFITATQAYVVTTALDGSGVPIKSAQAFVAAVLPAAPISPHEQ